MKKAGKILNMIMVLALLMLYSVSPVLAEEATGSTDSDSIMPEAVQAPEEDSGAGESPDSELPAEPLEELAETEEEAPETAEETAGTADAPIETAGESPDSELPAEPLEELAETEEEAPETAVESPGLNGSDVLNVIIPATVSITIDPFEIGGQGQIYSDIYEIKNFGDTDVLVTFTDIQVTFADDTNFESLARPFDERRGSELKSIYLLLDFGRPDIQPAVTTDPGREGEISIPLSAPHSDAAENSFLSLSFSGNVNHYPEVPWEDNDVAISITYTIMPAPPPEEVIEPFPDAEEEMPDAGSVTPGVPEAAESELPSSEPADTPMDEEVITEPPQESIPTETPIETPTETPIETPIETPSETGSEAPEPPQEPDAPPETPALEAEPPPDANP